MFEEGEEEEVVTEPQETVVEEPAEEEAEETEPQADAEPKADSEPAKPTLLQLLTGEHAPEWLAEQLEIAGKEDQDLEVTPEEIRNLEPAAQRVVANIFRAAQKGAPQAAQQLTEMNRRKEELDARERLLQARQAEVLKAYHNPKLQALLDKWTPQGERPDPNSREGREWEMKAFISGAMKEFIDGFKAADAEEEAKRQQLEEDHKAKELEQQEIAYVAQHLDFFRDEHAQELVKKHMGRGYPIEEAHKLALGELLLEERAADGKLEEAEVVQSRRRVRPGKRSTSSIPATPKGLTVEALNDWYDAHPDAMKRDLDELERRASGG